MPLSAIKKSGGFKHKSHSGFTRIQATRIYGLVEGKMVQETPIFHRKIYTMVWRYTMGIYIYVYRKIDGFRRRFPVKANALKESLIQRRNYGLNQPIRPKKNQDLISIRSTESGLRSKPTPWWFNHHWSIIIWNLTSQNVDLREYDWTSFENAPKKVWTSPARMGY